MSEMVERVAIAIYTRNFEHLPFIAWEDANPDYRTEYRAWARAAIEAMREPTESVLTVAPMTARLRLWREMIAEALK